MNSYCIDIPEDNGPGGFFEELIDKNEKLDKEVTRLNEQMEKNSFLI